MICEDKDKIGKYYLCENPMPMRIFVIHNFYQHAGGEDAVFYKEVEILSTEHKVKTFTCRNQKGIKGICQFMSYPINLGMSKKIKQSIVDFKPDIVHIHNLHYAIGPWCIRSIYKLGIPIVMTLHNFRLLCPSASLFYQGEIFTQSIRQNFPWTAVRMRVLNDSFAKTFLTAFTYWVHRKLGTWNKVSKFIVLSDFAKSLFLESTLSVAEDKFVVRPNSVDMTPKRTIGGEGFVYIGRLSEEKGIVPLLSAFKHLPFSLAVYGSGPQQDIIEHFADKFKHIRYFGHQPSEVLRTAINDAEALIVPSVCYEGMPLTIIEAYAQGTPVLASNIGILNKMVLPLYTGMHFNPYDKEDIGRIVTKWINLNETTKQQIRENCIIEYKKHYTVQKNIAKLISIYKEATQQEGGKP
ncbi:glycosyltransferase [Sphingobacterium sp. SGR-19]|uniref:glycosyltransferase n=1 Tax=Sphingobacterium sp. SGR-19 TaxID=2710886 RepID=UPI0013EB99FD|nr:glycosyltransferase [Sphingobacterium sp. SGR-19]NGM66380.1 glycosyltransferase family 4 protein [Sphingobacterium sp. SGR-19]